MNTPVIIMIIAGILLQALFIKVEHEENYLLATILKGSAALMFVLVGYLGFLSTDNVFNRQFLIGLIFGMIGDILLELRYVFKKNGDKVFLLGILSFMIGHIMYLVALIPQARHGLIFGLIGAFVAACLLTYIYKTMDIKPAFKIFGVLYLGVVFIMCFIAIGIAIFNPNPRSILYAIGAVLFTASDVVLIFNTFSGTSRFSLRITNLSLYYIGQMMIACSLFL